MRISVFTDLHLLTFVDNADYAPVRNIISKLDATSSDVVIIPGDIEQSMYPSRSNIVFERFGCNNPWEKVLKMLRKHFRPETLMIFVPGNHEYYTQYFNGAHVKQPSMSTIDDYMRSACDKNGVVYLNAGMTYVHHGVAFIGATMWTNLVDPLPKNHKAWEMNDFGMIVSEDSDGEDESKKLTMTPKTYVTIHEKHKRNVLKSLLDSKSKGLKTVVITHHPPTMHPGCDKKIKSFEVEKYTRSEATEIAQAYCSTDLERLIGISDVWVYGHTHDTSAWRVGKTLLVTNGHGRDILESNFDPTFSFYA
jgi:Icc-related predicted phosphoesterase